MKSISMKVTIWSLAALALALACFILIGNFVFGRSATQNFTQFNQVLFRDAIVKYESGGQQELSSSIRELNRGGQVQVHLTDSQGHDLASGEDRSEIVRSTVGRNRPYYRADGRIAMGLASENGRYIWIVTTSTPSFLLFAPFYVLLLITVVALYWLVTANITRPLRHLAGVVERFGKGELNIRAIPRSNDEVGNLGRSFNAMAARIGTLLTTERQLLQDVSHELRSPLARLTFEAEMVRKTTDRDAAATRLRREIERLSELVASLIDMARAEGEPGTMEMDDVSLNDLLLTTTEECGVEAEARGCRIDVRAVEELSIQGNAELLRRAFENVLRNAIRYAPSGTAVEVTLERDHDRAMISVRDRGPGIRAEMMEKIFDPFFREDPSRQESTGGLGLGLAIARRAVRLHHGDISVANASPGAFFRIAMPINLAKTQ